MIMRHIIYLNKVRLDDALPAVNFSLGNAYGIAQTGVRCTFIAQVRSADFDPDCLYARFDLEPLAGLDVIARPEQRRFGLKTNQWFYWDALEQIKALHRETRVDGIISRDPGALPYLYLLRRQTRIPVFYQPHNFYADLSLRPDINPKNAMKYHWLEHHFAGRMNGILCLQPSQAQLFSQYFPRTRVFPASPGLLKVYPGKTPPKNLNRLVYMGSLQPKKGIGVILDAMRNLETDYELLLIGGRNPSEIQAAQERVQSYQLGHRVKITGWLPFREASLKMESAAVGLLPLRDTFYNRYLTAPNKLFDYLSRGIPVVASDLPAIRDFLSEDEACFVPPEDAGRLASAVVALCRNRKTWNRLSAACLNKAGCFLWKHQAEKMIASMENSF